MRGPRGPATKGRVGRGSVGRTARHGRTRSGTPTHSTAGPPCHRPHRVPSPTCGVRTAVRCTSARRPAPIRSHVCRPVCGPWGLGRAIQGRHGGAATGGLERGIDRSIVTTSCHGARRLLGVYSPHQRQPPLRGYSHSAAVAGAAPEGPFSCGRRQCTCCRCFAAPSDLRRCV